MKLSQMTTNQAADAFMLLAPEIETLSNDADLISMIQNRQTTKDKSKAITLGISFIMQLSVYLLKNHRNTIWTVLSILNDKSVEEIGKQLFPVTLKQLMNTINDKDFMSFFQQSDLSEPIK